MPLDWTPLLSITADDLSDLLVVHHDDRASSKLQVRVYTLRFRGTQQSNSELLTCLRRQLLKYVFPETLRPEEIDWALARDKFGDIDPASDGKLGEMLLYLFVEAFLKAPMIAYKLKDLGNPNDQVKGADGVFVGHYEGQSALLIGESKIYQSLDEAVDSAFVSLKRFHESPQSFSHELFIARKCSAELALSTDHLKEIDSLLERKHGILVHPVFISHDATEIRGVSDVATSADDAEQRLKELFEGRIDKWKALSNPESRGVEKLKQVFLDFIYLPVETSVQLRNDFYSMLHGHPYESNAVKAAVRKTKTLYAPKKKAARKSPKSSTPATKRRSSGKKQT